MSKRNSDGDVLFNRLAVGVAQEQSLLASLMGGDQHLEPSSEAPYNATEDEDLIFTGDYEQCVVQTRFFQYRLLTRFRFGVGAPIPRDIENGTFTRRVPTSDDKLLQQLVGKKAAKAHLDARQASKTGAKQPGQRHVNPQAAPKKEESEDEEEGRASMFKSKKRKVVKARPVEVEIKKSESNDDTVNGVPPLPHQAISTEIDDQKAEDDSGPENRKKPSKSRHQPSKPASYLDQLLTERLKKKTNKSKPKADA
jgi:hypothetical protein